MVLFIIFIPNNLSVQFFWQKWASVVFTEPGEQAITPTTDCSFKLINTDISVCVGACVCMCLCMCVGVWVGL